MNETRHIFSVDVEDWFEGLPLDAAGYSHYPSRLEDPMRRLLDVLASFEVKATFFWLASAARRHPALLQETVAQGHEIACHGNDHTSLLSLTPSSFRERLRDAKTELEDLVRLPIQGHRAPYFSITNSTLWAFEILAELGFSYDSSVVPVRYWRYGIPGFSEVPTFIHTPCGPIMEYPMSVRHLCGIAVPFSGGAYLRILPYAFVRRSYESFQQAGKASILYIHPWELDPEHPKVRIASSLQITHYANLKSTLPTVLQLLREFSFGSFAMHHAEQLHSS
jgi:polysaccharide deacetylase family protein (PEP-CTERM system associated)